MPRDRAGAMVLGAATLALCAVLLADCSGPPGRSVEQLPGSSATSSAQSPASTSVPADVRQGVEKSIEEFNATAGGPVAAQRAELLRVLSTGQSAAQRKCAVATTTISFEPVYARLAPAPGWRPTTGTLPGTVYALPTLIRIYTDDRITGTDLTDLHIAFDAGEARLPALCLG